MRACSAAETALAAAQVSSMEACRPYREIVDAAVRAAHRRAGDERIECATTRVPPIRSTGSMRRQQKSSAAHLTVFAPHRPARDILRNATVRLGGRADGGRMPAPGEAENEVT